MREFPLQALFALFGRIGGARRRKPTVKFLLDQCGVFQQSNDFGPDDLIEQILADKAAVVANRTTQFSPAIGTNTFVVVDFACARLRGCTREGVAALLTADQPLHDTGARWFDGAIVFCSPEGVPGHGRSSLRLPVPARGSRSILRAGARGRLWCWA